MPELAIAQRATGDTGKAEETLGTDHRTGEGRKGRAATELRARIEAAYLRLLSDPEGDGRRASRARDELRFPLSRHWRRSGALSSVAALRVRPWRAAWPPPGLGARRGTCARPLSSAPGCHWRRASDRSLQRSTGARPGRPKAIERCDGLSDETIGHSGRASVIAIHRWARSAAWRFRRARELVAAAEQIYEELGSSDVSDDVCGAVLGDIELLAADYPAAERTLREQCAFFERIRRPYSSRGSARRSSPSRSTCKDDSKKPSSGRAYDELNAATDDLECPADCGAGGAKLLAGRAAIFGSSPTGCARPSRIAESDR